MDRVKARMFDFSDSVAGGSYSRAWTDLGEIDVETPLAEMDPQGEMIHRINSPIKSRVDDARRIVIGQEVYDIVDQEEDEDQESRKLKITTFLCKKREEAYIGDMPPTDLKSQKHKKKLKGKKESLQPIDEMTPEPEVAGDNQETGPSTTDEENGG